ncbi:MAG: hypothetical protein RR268_05770, partial [Kiritimatiellia bacterium]
MWTFFYAIMKILPSRFLQRTFWFLLRKSHISNALCDEGFLKLQLLGVTGEVFNFTGGINSLI